MEFFHLLNVNKKPGRTSRDVVDQVQRLIRPAKVGHAGTLDPLAAGILVMCLGQTTRLIEYVQRMKKSYQGTFLLGRRSDTEDTEGAIEELPDPPRPTLQQLESAAFGMRGEIMQRPPMYSALKVQGRRAYELARKGQAVELQPRPIHVYRMAVVRYEYPELTLDIECGSGTYVRSLGRDLAESLGTAAVMSALTRTAIGPFTMETACDADELSRENLMQWLLSAQTALADLPRITISEEQRLALANGQPVMISGASRETVEAAALLPDGRLAALIAPRPDGHWWPTRNFAGRRTTLPDNVDLLK